MKNKPLNPRVQPRRVLLSAVEQTAIQQWAWHERDNPIVRGIAVKLSSKRRGRKPAAKPTRKP